MGMPPDFKPRMFVSVWELASVASGVLAVALLFLASVATSLGWEAAWMQALIVIAAVAAIVVARVTSSLSPYWPS